MNNTAIFIWGAIATFLAVGPLVVAAYLDWKRGPVHGEDKPAK